ncbi:GntR family transcriptional regulator [Alkalihalobacterium elongatum]|uniref:GntR family transcriptional regulator n=1 Tax=Alkalihalobacterium elongatum TaxID=2675466 RepID=UPI001C1FDE48|nr:GntR family transcriptional regulator [Alkalihalobacterium elongatum]
MKVYQTKKEIIYSTLKKEIYEGIYEFGEKLVISQLAKRFKSSEIPVREAMNQLKSESLIEFKPHVGAIVSTLSPKDIRNIFELRIELEGLATRLAVDRLDEKDLEEIRNILDISIKSYKEKDYEHFEKQNVKFHMKIYNACENHLLTKNIEDLWRNTNRYPSLFKENDNHIKLSIQEHEDIYTALLQKNGVLAEMNMLKHKARAGKGILSLTQQDFYKGLDESDVSKTQRITTLEN